MTSSLSIVSVTGHVKADLGKQSTTDLCAGNLLGSLWGVKKAGLAEGEVEM